MWIPFVGRIHLIKAKTLNKLLNKIETQSKQIGIMMRDNQAMAVALKTSKHVVRAKKSMKKRKKNEAQEHQNK